MYLLLWIAVIFHVRFTIWGWALWLLLPLLHRFVFRYFWTRFEVYEYEFAPARAEILLRRKENRKKASAIKKAIFAFEATLVLAVAVAAFIVTEYPPFKVDSFEAVMIERDLEIAEDLYKYANEYLQEEYPGVQLIAYRLGFEERGWKHEDGTTTDYTWCYMFFRDPRQGVIVTNLKELIWVQICTEYDYMFCDYLYINEGKYASAQAIEFVPIPGDYPEGFYK